MAKVAIVMGSGSDKQIMENARNTLHEFGVKAEERILSAHRNPDAVSKFAKEARDRGLEVIIAGAGKSAALAGAIASHTTLPVIGVPIKASDLGGMDSLLSTVQMPSGVPVATVAINGAHNAALLAIEILALQDENLATKLASYKKELAAPHIEKETKEEETPIVDG